MHLSLKHISLSLSGKSILDDVSIDIADREFVSILGESGAGKSTTLRIVAGLTFQDEGVVEFDGTCVDALPAHRRNTAIVFQDIRLFPNMNVEENVAFSLRMKGVDKGERRRIAREFLAAVHLEGMEERRTNELSGGQQQRVALARALAGKPRAILLDEPFSGLDEQLREEMRMLVLSLHRAYDMTSLMVTHDPDEAFMMSDRVVYLSDGRIIQEGSPAELLLHPKDDIVASSLDESSAVKGVVEEGTFSYGKLRVPAEDAPDGPAVLVRVKGGEAFVHPLPDGR